MTKWKSKKYKDYVKKVMGIKEFERRKRGAKQMLEGILAEIEDLELVQIKASSVPEGVEIDINLNSL